MRQTDETHAFDLRSWVATANVDSTDFPIQNLPFGIFRRRRSGEPFRGGVAIGDQIVDLAAAVADDLFHAEVETAARAASACRLNEFMAMGPPAWSALRLALSRALREGAVQRDKLASCLVPQASVEYSMPCTVGDYTDFYVGIHHATAIGKLFRPQAPLLPNYPWVPIGYHGRSSAVMISGEPVYRPVGQSKGSGDVPDFGPSKRVDYEMELGFLIGVGNRRGQSIPIQCAESYLFGVTMLNDWSARDIQAWEYQPLGPFLSKNFGTTISPWVITFDALAPFRSKFERPSGEVQPLPYLSCDENGVSGAIDVQLEVLLQTEVMRQSGLLPESLARCCFRDAAYWTPAQLVAHHTVGGCNLAPGDLLGSGTLSGPRPPEAGSLMESTNGGRDRVALKTGETRSFLEDGDTVILRAWCERTGSRRIGFGECVGTVLPPLERTWNPPGRPR